MSEVGEPQRSPWESDSWQSKSEPDLYSSEKIVANAVSRYYVKIDGIEHAVFSEVSGLQLDTELFEYQEGGNNSYVHKLPTVTKAGNITLRRGVAKDNSLFNWYMHVINGSMELREVDITLYATQRMQPVVTWHFSRAFPCKWSGPQLAAGTDTVAIETIELAHMGELKATVRQQ